VSDLGVREKKGNKQTLSLSVQQQNR